jgi:hypothetical protein
LLKQGQYGFENSTEILQKKIIKKNALYFLAKALFFDNSMRSLRFVPACHATE